MTAAWQEEYEAFQKRSLADRDYVYIWVDGMHVNVRLEEDRLCLLVVVGARPDGTKKLIGITDGCTFCDEGIYLMTRRFPKTTGREGLPSAAQTRLSHGRLKLEGESLVSRKQRAYVMKEAILEEAAFWDAIYSQHDPEEIGGALGQEYFYAKWAQHRKWSYVERFFMGLIQEIRDQRVLSIGGGIDRVALYLARTGNETTAIEISSEAVERTALIADQLGLRDRVRTRCLDCHESDFEQEFDIVITKDSLHHMDRSRAVERISRALVDGGVFLAMEPVCRSSVLRFLHRTLPYHPDPLPYVEGESELTDEDLAFIEEHFREVESFHFALLARESVAFTLNGIGAGRWIAPISRFDYHLMRWLAPLRRLGSYMIVRAIK